MKLKETILAKALELFNENGIEYVGMREIAGHLDLKLGNITYYFPTKEALIHELATRFAAINATIAMPDASLSILVFFDRLKQINKNQYQYRCLLLSFVHLLKQYPAMFDDYKKKGLGRTHSFKKSINLLVKNDYLVSPGEDALKYLALVLQLTQRFWISDAAISYSFAHTEKAMTNYHRMVAHAFLPFVTQKGELEINAILGVS